jgi:hypothetical protein
VRYIDVTTRISVCLQFVGNEHIPSRDLVFVVVKPPIVEFEPAHVHERSAVLERQDRFQRTPLRVAIPVKPLDHHPGDRRTRTLIGPIPEVRAERRENREVGLPFSISAGAPSTFPRSAEAKGTVDEHVCVG